MGYNKTNPIGANGFTDDLRARSRLRRQTLKRLAEPGAAPRPPRNDILPKLEFGLRALSDLSLPSATSAPLRRPISARSPLRLAPLDSTCPF